MNNASIEYISECFIKPKYDVEGSKQQIYLSPWDLADASIHYIQQGLLFLKPPNVDSQVFSIKSYLKKLNDSLALTLVHFYPLAGRLATLKTEDPQCYTIYIDCVNSPGARFIYAAVNMTVSDILSSSEVPIIVQSSFFDHDRAINHDGHVLSLLSVQVTELADGIFIGCSINHMVADGTSFWHFFNSWSEIFGKRLSISRPPILDRWMPDGHGPIISLPFSHHSQFVIRHEPPPFTVKFFHFSSKSISKLKQKANTGNNDSINISSLQALAALVWRSITRARNFPYDQLTHCSLAINNRSRLVPRISNDYIGNYLDIVMGTAKSGQLLENGLAWSANLLNQAIAKHTNEKIRCFVSAWIKEPVIYNLGQVFDPFSVAMVNSPRFEIYENEFGLGKAVAVRSGYANKSDGNINIYPTDDGNGGMDLEVCLSLDHMKAILSDEEFVAAVTDQSQHSHHLF